MRRKELRDCLEQYTVPEYDPERLQFLIREAEEIPPHPERERMTAGKFFLNQLRFIRGRTWILKIIITAILIIGVFMEDRRSGQMVWPLFSMISPLLCLVHARELCNICQPGMMELQLTARNSPAKVFLIRMIVFGVCDVAELFLISIWGGRLFSDVTGKMVLYSIVPYLFMCTGCLVILDRCREENVLLGCVVWGCLLSAVIFCTTVSGWDIYGTDTGTAWLLAGIITFFVLLWQAGKLMRKMGGNQNEINVGTFI